MWPTERNRQAWEERFGRRGAGGRGAAERPGPGLAADVRARLPDLDGKHVLHLPCGSGEATAALVELGALVTGVDADPSALAAARERAPGAAFFQADLHDLPLQLRRGRFDLVFADEGALEEPAALEPFLAGVLAVLRRGGALVLWDWHPVAACLDPVTLRWRESYFAEGVPRLGEVVTAVAAAGFELAELAELPAPPPSGPGARLDPRVPARLLLRARKPVSVPA
jgi:SAM-dependent methyltransferase